MPSTAISLVTKIGLDALAFRHQAIATNIAHANSAHFSPVRTDFAYFLDQVTTEDVRSLAVDDQATGVSIEQEMVNLNENVMRYQTLTNLIAKQFSLMQDAITGGRG